MAWKKAKNNQPAVGKAVLGGEAGEQVWRDAEGDLIFATSPDDFPKPVVPTTFMGIPAAAPPEGSMHSLLLKVAADVAAIKHGLGIV